MIVLGIFKLLLWACGPRIRLTAFCGVGRLAVAYQALPHMVSCGPQSDLSCCGQHPSSDEEPEALGGQEQARGPPLTEGTAGIEPVCLHTLCV